ncbi:hypothetical protein HYPSUDRAFT_311024 [Hypholoma sublateritium FD-334 SS-4]|uniref:Uncharacterized protein n=1 Tax=Hypholoma sublateritium (strain FD-334 SS-4) TaxID=945553 RepID=A0A0D2LFA5_HYPSF|nr:hypothetical protein HYPSUDRAFT_311024 [Hypholoma sublateritium FD-334 SS-4]
MIHPIDSSVTLRNNHHPPDLHNRAPFADFSCFVGTSLSDCSLHSSSLEHCRYASDRISRIVAFAPIYILINIRLPATSKTRWRRADPKEPEKLVLNLALRFPAQSTARYFLNSATQTVPPCMHPSPSVTRSKSWIINSRHSTSVTRTNPSEWTE